MNLFIIVVNSETSGFRYSSVYIPMQLLQLYSDVLFFFSFLWGFHYADLTPRYFFSHFIKVFN
jgi:hypothetical protein